MSSPGGLSFSKRLILLWKFRTAKNVRFRRRGLNGRLTHPSLPLLVGLVPLEIWENGDNVLRRWNWIHWAFLSTCKRLVLSPAFGIGQSSKSKAWQLPGKHGLYFSNLIEEGFVGLYVWMDFAFFVEGSTIGRSSCWCRQTRGYLHLTYWWSSLGRRQG